MFQAFVDKLQHDLNQSTMNSETSYVVESSITSLGGGYIVVSRRVSEQDHPHIYNTFGAPGIAILEMSLNHAQAEYHQIPGEYAFGDRFDIEKPLDLIYSQSVLPEREIVRAVIQHMATLGYKPNGIAFGGYDDHLGVRILLTNADKEVYELDLTVNTK